MAFRQRKEDLREQDFRVLENDLTDIKELSAQFDDHTSSLRSNLEVFISTLAPVKDLFATFQHKLEEAQRKDNERQNDLGVTEHNCALLTAELTDAKTRDDDLSKSLDLLDIDQRAKVSRVQLLNVELNKTKEKDTEISLKLIDVQNEKEALLLKIRQLESATQEELEPLNQSLQLAREKKNEICDTTELNKVAVENIMKLYRDTCEEHKFLSSALDQKKSLLQELLDLEEQVLSFSVCLSVSLSLSICFCHTLLSPLPLSRLAFILSPSSMLFFFSPPYAYSPYDRSPHLLFHLLSVSFLASLYFPCPLSSPLLSLSSGLLPPLPLLSSTAMVLKLFSNLVYICNYRMIEMSRN